MEIRVETRDVERGVTLVASEYMEYDLNLVLLDRGMRVLLDTSTSYHIPRICEVVGLPHVAVISHSHEDHAGGSGFLASKGVITVAHRITAGFLADARTAVDSFFPDYVRRNLSEGERVRLEEVFTKSLGEPKVTSTDLKVEGVQCLPGFGHTLGSILCRVGEVLFTADSIQGEGIRGRESRLWNMPQVVSMRDYLVTLGRVARMKVETLIPAHNYLPSTSRLIQGSEADKFVHSSLESALRLLEIGESILNEEPLTLREFARRLSKEYNGRDSVYGGALVTGKAILDYFRPVIKRVKEGDVVLYHIP